MDNTPFFLRTVQILDYDVPIWLIFVGAVLLLCTYMLFVLIRYAIRSRGKGKKAKDKASEAPSGTPDDSRKDSGGGKVSGDGKDSGGGIKTNFPRSDAPESPAEGSSSPPATTLDEIYAWNHNMLVCPFCETLNAGANKICIACGSRLTK